MRQQPARNVPLPRRLTLSQQRHRSEEVAVNKRRDSEKEEDVRERENRTMEGKRAISDMPFQNSSGRGGNTSKIL